MSKILKQVRSHPDVIPVFVITGLGACFAGAAILRSCWVYSDVSFRRKSNPHPWLNVRQDQNLKFIRVRSYKDNKNHRPNFEEED